MLVRALKIMAGPPGRPFGMPGDIIEVSSADYAQLKADGACEDVGAPGSAKGRAVAGHMVEAKEDDDDKGRGKEREHEREPEHGHGHKHEDEHKGRKGR